MNAEKMKQREIIKNLKIQILQKDKEISYLRERTEALRKLVRRKKLKTNSDSKELIG